MNRLYTLTLLILAAVISTGCSNKDSAKPAAAAKGDAHDHDHDHDHDHGHAHGHDHVHAAGPNGGIVFDLGAHHAEVTFDHTKPECVVLILADDEKTPKAITATELLLVTKEAKTADGKAVPSMAISMKPADAAEGKATKYVGTDPGLANVADFEGTVTGEIDGKPSNGDFKK